MSRKIIYNSPFRMDETLEQFEKRAKMAKDAGFTHYDLSALTDRSRWCLDDVSDPWLQWNLANPNFFKRIVPDELKDFVPADIAKKELDMAKKRGKILEKLGLKAIYYAWEPSWMPEVLFEQHPDWRGPRIDHARRTKGKRFAACMDHPGVLKMYKDMVTKLVKEIPSIDTFFLHTNDSGSGMCWTEFLYNNANGPTACKNVNIGDRISNFLQNIADGATDAGAQNPEVIITSQLSRNEANAVLPKLRKNMVLADWNGTVDSQVASYSGFGNATYAFPFRYIPRYISLANSMTANYNKDKLLVGVEATCDKLHDEYMEMVAVGLKARKFGPKEKNELLLKMAAKTVNKDKAYDLLGAWEQIQSGFNVIGLPQDGGTIFDLGLLMQRWINRPFVPFPAELTSDERDYYEKFQFQANDDERKFDMLNVQDTFLIDTRVGARFFDDLWRGALIGNLSAAAKTLESLIPSAVDEESADLLCKSAYSLKAIVCFARSAVHCAHFQTFMYEFGENDGLVFEKYIDVGDRDREFIYNIYRQEIDNIYELIGILDKSPTVLMVAEKEEYEDTFTFSPKFKDQLKKKIAIMMDHWQDFDRLFPRPNF